MKSETAAVKTRRVRPRSLSLQGIGVSPGVVIGPAFVLADPETHIVERAIAAADVEAEVARFEEALIRTRGQIRDLQDTFGRQANGGDPGILDAHLMVLDDRTFIEDVIQRVSHELRNAESVVADVAGRYARSLAAVEDDYLRERVADVKDVARRIIRNLSERNPGDTDTPGHRHIVVAHDLAPSETAAMRKDMVIGFATDLGSPTSHTAVMARSLEIPAVVSLRDISRRVRTGDEILIDGNKGTLIVGPTREQLAEYGKVSKARRNIEEDLSHLRDEPAVTPDGRRIILSANVESGAEADSVEDHGAEGIGLFRTEYLYLTLNRAVGEDEQAGIYRKVAERLAPHPVIIRTLDLGGDKFFGGGEPVHEPNPFLGCRSIRLSLQHVEHFKAQLRAILRASVCGNVKVMYPMISGVGEVVRANEVLAEAKSELRAAGVPFDDGIETGVMIEIPSAALTADAIAEHAHFFSIGTNDLIQYTIAVDRVNERVAYLYAPTHPAVLKLIRLTVEAAHRRGIWVGVCGEMAADPLMTPLLLGMDVDELSVAPVAVPVVKDAIRSIEYGRARRLVEEASADPSPADILSRCRQMLREVAPEILELT